LKQIKNHILNTLVTGNRDPNLLHLVAVKISYLYSEVIFYWDLILIFSFKHLIMVPHKPAHIGKHLFLELISSSSWKKLRRKKF
jgi:hypothetical protein